MVVRADPVRRGLLYAGTDTGVWVSFDDGSRWQPLQQNLPTCWVTRPQGARRRPRAGTNGRGLWVLDDVTPLRQITPATAASAGDALCAGHRDPRAREPEPGHAAAARGARGAKPSCRRGDRLFPARGLAAGPVRLEILDAQGSDRARVLERRSAREARGAALLHGSLCPSSAASPGGRRVTIVSSGICVIRGRSRTIRVHDLGGRRRGHADRAAGASGACRAATRCA